MSTSTNHHDAQDALDVINKRTGRNMPQAVATGAVLVILIAGTLLASPQAFAYLLIVFMLLGIWELRVDFATIGIYISPVAMWLCSIFMLLSTYYFPDHLLALGTSTAASLFIVSLAAALTPFRGSRVHRAVASKVVNQNMTAHNLSVAHSSRVTAGLPAFVGRVPDVCTSMFAVLYIPLLAAFLILLLLGSSPQMKVLMAIFIPALGDTGGLVFGAALGKHKLSPRISPKKTYEGLAGSALFCVIGATLFYGFAFPVDFLAGHWWRPVVMGLVIALTATFGDLCASMLKRDIGIKDMGHLLKGHGGVLDRVDSILISAPFVYLLFSLFGV